LNFSVGYGAEEMTGAFDNSSADDSGAAGFERYRQFYFSPDVDLTKIKTRSKALKTVFSLFGFLKIPAPTLEITDKGNAKFHWLYF